MSTVNKFNDKRTHTFLILIFWFEIKEEINWKALMSTRVKMRNYMRNLFGIIHLNFRFEMLDI